MDRATTSDSYAPCVESCSRRDSPIEMSDGFRVWHHGLCCVPIELSPALVGTLIHFPLWPLIMSDGPPLVAGRWTRKAQSTFKLEVNILWWNFCRHNSSLLLVSDPKYIISEPSSTGSESGRLEHAHMAFDVW